MYNEQRKEQYIKERKEKAILSINTEKAFELAEPIEKEYGRDMCEWDSTEILDFYRYYNTSSLQSLIVINNAMVIYTDWCLVNGLVSDGQNHYREISPDLLTSCLNQNALDLSVITRERLIDSISELPNFSDKFIILGIFEGISPRAEIMPKVKLSDLDGSILTLPNGIKINVSKELQAIMKYANNETEYIGMTKRNFVYEYIPSEYIIRHFISRKGVEDNPVIFIGTRLRKCFKWLGMQNFTMKQLSESGRIDFIKRMMNDYNISLYDAINGKRYREMHETIYGTIQSRPNYINTYGKYYNVSKNPDT